MVKTDSEGRQLYLDKNGMETTSSIYHIPVTVQREYEAQMETVEKLDETGQMANIQQPTGKYYKPVFTDGHIVSFELADEAGTYEIQVDTVEENTPIIVEE